MNITSKDGTQIGYTQMGDALGLILVQGALGTSHNYRDLAQALSSDFTVYKPDRRGRGMSQRPFTPNREIQRDVEDNEALSTHTGATSLFGLRSGAVISLTSTLRIGMIRKAVLCAPLDGPAGSAPLHKFSEDAHDSKPDPPDNTCRTKSMSMAHWLSAITIGRNEGQN